MYSNELVVKILNYIDNNIFKKITMDELERTFFFNKDYIMRLFKKELNITIIEYINKKRICLSLKELKDTEDSILKCALNNGFNSQEYFSEVFKKIIGVQPITYRNFNKINLNISYKTIDIITNNVVNLNYLFSNINRYKNNVRKTDTRSLSLKKTI